MRIAMAQMKMTDSISENLDKTVHYIEKAKQQNADLVFFPEVQLSPFFPQYENKNADKYLLNLDSEEIRTIQNVCQKYNIYASPNVYLNLNGNKYDASLFIDGSGNIQGISKMVHIAQAKYFYEQDYYTPSDDGFKVYDTPFGKIGIVICFDRHIPESIRACALQGAELIIIPTANLIIEPSELFEWEVRVQSFQNLSYIAMCNRVGTEGDITFCGESLITSPSSELLFKANDTEQLIVSDIPLETVQKERQNRDWLTLSQQNKKN